MNSTVRGKKLCPGFASLEDTAVTKTTLLPHVTKTEPSVCLARRPVSIVICFPAIEVVTVLTIF